MSSGDNALFLVVYLVRKHTLWHDWETRAQLQALRERQPRRKAGVRKATDLLAEAAGLPNSGGALEKAPLQRQVVEGNDFAPTYRYHS